MALKRLTVVNKNGDTSFAGTVLFNSTYMQDVKNSGVQTSFSYRKTETNANPDKYLVSDALATVDAIFDVPTVTYMIVTVRDDVNDSTSSTTNKVVDLNDIIKGIALPSDTTQSLLWIQDTPKKVVKILADKFLKAITDLSSTGTTTTYE